MPRFVDIQTNFSTGELDPLLRSRIDLAQYNNALAKATNVVVQPQGGIRRRPGLKHIAELPNTAANGVRLVPFEFSVDDSYMLCFVNERMYVFKDGVQITAINGGANPYLTTTIFSSIPKYAFTLTVTTPTSGHLTPSAVSGNVTLTSQNSAFSAGSVGQYINAYPQGRARIIQYITATSVKAVTEYPFFDTSNIAQGSWEIESGYEDVWSSGKGWPRTVTFHEGRLYFGGSKSRPSTIWGSKIGIFDEFMPTEAFDDDAVEATLDTSSLNVIVDMISGRDLQVFTTGAEFYVPQSGTDPITPLTLTFKGVSRNGIKPGTRVQSLESGTVYIQRQGKSINEFLFSDTQLTYVTQRISLLSGHLLKAPTRMALRRATSTDEGDLLLMVNDTDGTMAAFSIMRSQQITAPSEFITDGLFKDVSVDVTDIYAVVKRTFNSTDKYFVELFSFDRFTDCAFVGGAASGATSLPHIGESLNVICDGVPQGNETVSAGGAVTFDRASTASYEVGLPFTVYAKTMPVEIKLQTGTRIGFKKRIVEINALVDNTQHLELNENPVPFRTFDNPLLDDPEPTYTGSKRVNGVLGYSREASIEISQSLPLKMTLLGLEYKIAVTGGT